MPELPPPPAGVDAEPWRAVAGWINVRRVSMRPAVMAVAAVATVAVLGVIAWMAFRQDTGPPVELTLPRAGSGVGQGGATGSTETDGGPRTAGGRGGPDKTGVDVVIVHVAGAVARPGLYRLAAESRLADAVDAAGGFLPDADPDSVNLAARLNDGERIYLPRRGETIATPAAGSAQVDGGEVAALLDLNSATAEQLEGLPGVGPSTASAILDYRKERRFRSIDELLEVRGIGPSKFAALRSRVTVR